MIFEGINTSLEALERLWAELAAQLDELSAVDATHFAELTALRAEAVDARDAIVDERPGLRALSLAALLLKAEELVRGSDDSRNELSDGFAELYTTGVVDRPEVGRVRDTLDRLAEQTTAILGHLEMVTTAEGERAGISGIRNGVDNLTSYPLLTSGDGLSSAAPTRTSPGSDLQRTIDSAMKKTLGRMPRAGDFRSFQAALNQSFSFGVVDGNSVVKWEARSYVGATELGGAVSGAQASLYTRATLALDSTLPILEGLRPLRPAFDAEEIEAATAIVRVHLTTVVAELGKEGGPRVPRVDGLFALLLEEPMLVVGDAPPAGVTIKGSLGHLRHVFGLYQDAVNTLDEEQAVTDFFLLQDTAGALEAGWTRFRDEWYGQDLGTRLVVLARALSVVAEGVGEVEAAMDSVFVGPSERSVSSFHHNGRKVYLSELLSWLTSFAEDEAPRLVREAGRRGVAAIISTAFSLEQILDGLCTAVASEPGLPDGLRHPRVRHPLNDLRSHLRRVAQLAQDVRQPTVVSV